MTPITFAPDADPTTPGVIVEATNLIPTDRGYQDAPQKESLTNDPVDDPLFTARSACMLRMLNGDARIFVGGSTGLYERVYAGWAKRITPSVATGSYGLRQFGDATLAGSYTEAIQTTSGPFWTSFAAITGAPSSNILCVTSTHQVMAIGGTGNRDGWACSALGDHTSWTPALATQAAEGRFLATPGPMTGGIEFGPHIVAFKERSMYWMRYANVPIIWATEVISNEVGTVAKNSVMDIGERILFVGADDFYSFDGTKPVPIGQNIRRWFFGRLNWLFKDLINGVYDASTGCAWWWYPLAGESTVNMSNAVVYHVPSGRWGHASTEVGVPVILRERMAGSQSPFLLDSSSGPYMLGAFANGDLHAIRARTGAASLRLGWFGDDMTPSTVTKWRPRFLKKPASASATFYKSEDLETEDLTGTSALHEGVFSGRQQAHWHSAELSLTGEFELTQIGNDLPRPAGRRA